MTNIFNTGSMIIGATITIALILGFGISLGRSIQRKNDVGEFLYFVGLRANQEKVNPEFAKKNFAGVLSSYLIEIPAKRRVIQPFRIKHPFHISEKEMIKISEGLAEELSKSLEVENEKVLSAEIVSILSRVFHE